MTTQIYSKGLKGVVAVQTKVSLVDGANTTLCYRGIGIHELVDHASFEEVCYLLLYGKAPTCRELIDFTSTLAAHRAIPGPIMELLGSLPRNTSPMDPCVRRSPLVRRQTPTPTLFLSTPCAARPYD